MKTFRRSLLLTSLVFLSVTWLTWAASGPAMDVMVSTSAGKLVYRGKTDAKGLFATPNLAPGSYVVQFNSTSAKGGPYALVVSAGKKKVVADSVPAGRFSKGGVAMKVEVDKAMNLTGQVAVAGTAPMTEKTNNAKVKYVNGVKYVWMQGETGSNLGGRWVEAGSPAAQNVQNVGKKGLTDMQARTTAPGGGN